MKITENGIKANIIPFKTIDEAAQKLLPAVTSERVALAGGSTFLKLYRAWRAMDINIADSRFMPVDERVVDFDRPESNWGTAWREFFSPMNLPDAARAHPSSVEDYRRIYHAVCGSAPGLTAVLLGIGDDGHCASIFPGTAAAKDFSSEFLATRSPKGIKNRLTMGYRTILNTDHLAIIITQGKEEALAALKDSQSTLPYIQVLRNFTGTADLYVDSAML
ncbi:MAG: 6-phosphogluconolactonase [Fibrobacterota bacterium]